MYGENPGFITCLESWLRCLRRHLLVLHVCKHGLSKPTSSVCWTEAAVKSHGTTQLNTARNTSDSLHIRFWIVLARFFFITPHSSTWPHMGLWPPVEEALRLCTVLPAIPSWSLGRSCCVRRNSTGIDVHVLYSHTSFIRACYYSRTLGSFSLVWGSILE